ncbi:MAG: hypothetical protein D6712_10065 [Chloroflexi bacterium]|nr:MAG: hypothetical protein D6712_10065 [Chloroflexota bacterium]
MILSFGSRNSGPPAWFIFLIGIALVFALYYIWLGFRNFVQTGGLGVQEATQQAEVVFTATAVRREQQATSLPTSRPTLTPLPECQDFIVTAENAIVRERPTTNSGILTSFNQNTVVCVIQREGESEWYMIDAEPQTRRINIGYMHESVIRALNPTPTPTQTFTPAPTVTPMPTLTPSNTPIPQPTSTVDTSSTSTPTPTPTWTPTPPVISA